VAYISPALVNLSFELIVSEGGIMICNFLILFVTKFSILADFYLENDGEPSNHNFCLHWVLMDTRGRAMATRFRTWRNP
jgi:hypothetical protein